jgi:uncharacterized membrane protein
VLNSMISLFKRCILVLFAVGALGYGAEAMAQQPGLFELWVGHELVECPSDPARLCYQTKTEQYDDWSVFEGSIGNFYYREGVAYILLVEMDPALGDREPQRTRYKVVQVLEEFETFAEPEISDRRVTEVAEPAVPEVTSEPLTSPPPAPVETAAIESEVDPAPPAAAVPALATESTPAAVPTEDLTVASEPIPPPPTATSAVVPAEKPTATSSPSPSIASSINGTSLRGTLIIGSGIEARSFTLCGEEASIWIEDESGQELWKAYRSQVAAPNLPLLIQFRGAMGPAPLSGFGAHYARQVTVIELLEADAQHTDCAVIAASASEPPPMAPTPTKPSPPVVPESDPSRIAIGGGPPAWTVDIEAAGIVYSSPATGDSIRFPYAIPKRAANGDTYLTSVVGDSPHSLKVVINKEPCPDPETGVRRDFTAYITLDGRWLRGCVREGTPIPAR